MNFIIIPHTIFQIKKVCDVQKKNVILLSDIEMKLRNKFHGENIQVLKG
jgi:hypothetical protein